jgi:cytochrome b pre-mRNA-processing protein 3
MILPLFRRNRRDHSIDGLYGAIVAQARLPVFYSGYRVPDIVEGRLEMVMLHAVLLLHRVEAGGDGLRELGQAVFDRFCQDMDDNLREMGVGDLSVPKQMQRIAGAFYGRARVYQEALARADPAGLVDALRRNIYADELAAGASARRLAIYVRDVVAHLRQQEATAFWAGCVSFPVPPAVETVG